jgi:hypothetical protein
MRDRIVPQQTARPPDGASTARAPYSSPPQAGASQWGCIPPSSPPPNIPPSNEGHRPSGPSGEDGMRFRLPANSDAIEIDWTMSDCDSGNHSRTAGAREQRSGIRRNRLHLRGRSQQPSSWQLDFAWSGCN